MATNRFYLFSWPGYESGGVEDDCLGSYLTLEDAMRVPGLNEIGRIIEMRDDGLWIVAEYSGYPPAWNEDERRLAKRRCEVCGSSTDDWGMDDDRCNVCCRDAMYTETVADAGCL